MQYMKIQMHSDKQCPFDGGSRSMKCMYKAPKEFSCCFTKLLHMQCIQGTFHSTECSQMQKTFFFFTMPLLCTCQIIRSYWTKCKTIIITTLLLSGGNIVHSFIYGFFSVAFAIFRIPDLIYLFVHMMFIPFLCLLDIYFVAQFY